MCQSVLRSYLRVRCQLETARCGTCCVTKSRWSLRFFQQLENKWFNYKSHQSGFLALKTQFSQLSCCLNTLSSFCPQTDWCVADPVESNMKIGLSLATAALLAALLSSIDAQGKWNHLTAVYLILHYRTLSLELLLLFFSTISTGCLWYGY